MITFKQSGDFKNTDRFLKIAERLDYLDILKKYGQMGVLALASATPVDTGLTSQCWDYQIKISKGTLKIYWTNSNAVDGVLIAILLQYGHGTKNGSYVQGRDYINPAIQSVFDGFADEAWKEVTQK